MVFSEQENPCSCGGFHDNEYQCSKCGLCSVDGEDIRYHSRHFPLSLKKEDTAVVKVDMDDMSNYIYLGLLDACSGR